MLIEWEESLATGVDQIDRQHREIFSRFNKLFTACSEGRGRDEVLQLLLFLHEYIKSHFAAEEELQLRSHYPEYAAHRLQHARFIADVDRLENTLKTEGSTLSLVIKTNQTLASWLLQHISKTDTEFAAFLKKNSPIAKE